MKKKIGDLTLKEITNMKCPRECSECPFGDFDENFLADKCCDLVNTADECNLLDQEIEVE